MAVGGKGVSQRQGGGGLGVMGRVVCDGISGGRRNHPPNAIAT